MDSGNDSSRSPNFNSSDEIDGSFHQDTVTDHRLNLSDMETQFPSVSKLHFYLISPSFLFHKKCVCVNCFHIDWRTLICRSLSSVSNLAKSLVKQRFASRYSRSLPNPCSSGEKTAFALLCHLFLLSSPVFFLTVTFSRDFEGWVI